MERREFLKKTAMAIVGATLPSGFEAFSPPEAQAKNRIELKENGNEKRVVVTGENLNSIHTDVYNKFVSVVGPELSRGAYVMANFQIEFTYSGKEFTIEYSVDLNPVKDENPNVQNVFDIRGTILDNEAEVKRANDQKRDQWIADNYDKPKDSSDNHNPVKKMWQERSEMLSCTDGQNKTWYHEAILFKGQR